MKAQKTKKKNVRGIIIKAILVLFLIYTLITSIRVWIRINEKKAQLGAVNEKIAAQQEKNDELNDLLEHGITDEYIARKARENGYGMPSERVYESNQKLS